MCGYHCGKSADICFSNKISCNFRIIFKNIWLEHFSMFVTLGIIFPSTLSAVPAMFF